MVFDILKIHNIHRGRYVSFFQISTFLGSCLTSGGWGDKTHRQTDGIQLYIYRRGKVIIYCLWKNSSSKKEWQNEKKGPQLLLDLGLFNEICCQLKSILSMNIKDARSHCILPILISGDPRKGFLFPIPSKMQGFILSTSVWSRTDFTQRTLKPQQTKLAVQYGKSSNFNYFFALWRHIKTF